MHALKLQNLKFLISYMIECIHIYSLLHAYVHLNVQMYIHMYLPECEKCVRSIVPNCSFNFKKHKCQSHFGTHLDRVM